MSLRRPGLTLKPSRRIRTPPAPSPPPSCSLFANDLGSRIPSQTWIDGYDAGIAFWDHYVGQVLDLLESEGARDSVCVVVMSDHGEHQGEQGVYGDHVSAYESVHHVPLIFSWPAGLPGGVVSDAFAHSFDIGPTSLRLGGVTDPRGLERPFAGRGHDG